MRSSLLVVSCPAGVKPIEPADACGGGAVYVCHVGTFFGAEPIGCGAATTGTASSTFIFALWTSSTCLSNCANCTLASPENCCGGCSMPSSISCSLFFQTPSFCACRGMEIACW